MKFTFLFMISFSPLNALHSFKKESSFAIRKKILLPVHHLIIIWIELFKCFIWCQRLLVKLYWKSNFVGEGVENVQQLSNISIFILKQYSSLFFLRTKQLITLNDVKGAWDLFDLHTHHSFVIGSSTNYSLTLNASSALLHRYQMC